MLADAAKLKIGSGASQTQYGICERPDWQAEYNPVLKAYGVAAFTETKATLDTPAALKAWQLMIAPMLNGDAVPEAQQQAKNGSSGCEPFFESGEAAMSIEVRGNLPGLQQAIGKQVPVRRRADAVDHGRQREAGHPDRRWQPGWGLAPGAVHNPLAIAFLKYLFSAAGQAVAEKTFGVVPAVASLNGPTALWRTQTGGPANSEAYVIAANTATIAPQTPGTVFTLSNTDIPNAVTAATTGGQSIAKAFTALQGWTLRTSSTASKPESDHVLKGDECGRLEAEPAALAPPFPGTHVESESGEPTVVTHMPDTSLASIRPTAAPVRRGQLATRWPPPSC